MIIIETLVILGVTTCLFYFADIAVKLVDYSTSRVIYMLYSLYHRFEEEGGVYCFCSVRPPVRDQKFPSQFSQQPCITGTSNLVWCFLQVGYRFQVRQLSTPCSSTLHLGIAGVYSVKKNSQISR